MARRHVNLTKPKTNPIPGYEMLIGTPLNIHYINILGFVWVFYRRSQKGALLP
jgi:hypothetical protein